MGNKHDQGGRYSGTCERGEKNGWQMDTSNTRMVSERMKESKVDRVNDELMN
jgi:hypothetical protein